MTREELKEHCTKQMEMCELWAIGKGEEPSGIVYEEHKLILELLEQEPCEDVVSRKEIINYIRTLACDLSYWSVTDEVVKDIEALPSVTPTRKKGHWIVEVWNNKEHRTCSVCQRVVDYEPCYHYCPYCGAKLEEESEERNE